MLNRYTSDKEEQKFILDNIINSPEWLIYGLIDTGYISKENAIFIDDNQKNVDTGNELRIISKKVEPDNYQSVIDLVNEMNLI